MNFANTLKDLRELHNVTQEELAEYLKVSRPTIAGYETKHRQPDYERLVKIAEFFQVSIDYLITGDESSANPEYTESVIDQKVAGIYKQLSLSSKLDALKYLQLLKLDETFKNK